MASNIVLSVITAMIPGIGGQTSPAAPPEAKADLRTIAPSPAEAIDSLIRMMPKAGDEFTPARDGYGFGPPLLICQQLRAHIINGDLSPRQWSDLLIASRVFKYRRQWPEGSPLVVELYHPAWLGASVEIRATARLEGGTTLRAGRTWCGLCGLSNSMLAEGEPATDKLPRYGPVGLLHAGPNTVTFDVEIRTGLPAEFKIPLPTPTAYDMEGGGLAPLRSASGTYWFEARTLAKVPVTLWVTQVAPGVFDKGFPHAESPEVAARMQTSVYPHFWADGKSRGYVAIWWRRRSEDQDLAMGLVVDLVRDGRVIESRVVQGNDWTASTDGALRPGAWDDEVIFDSLLGLLPKIAADAKELSRYQLTVHGDASAARTNWTASRWWAGSFTRSLADCLASDGTLHRETR